MELTLEYRFPRGPLASGRGAAIIDEELRLALRASVEMARNQIVPRTPVNTGVLRHGVQTQIALVGEPVQMVGRVLDPVAHAVPVEEGTRPHFPPRGPLELWVRRKFDISDEREVRSVAFLVARAISRRGTKPVHMFRDGFGRAKPAIRARLAEALKRAAARLRAS